MKNIFFSLSLFFTTLSLSSFAQDRIIKITNDTIKCQIKEISEDEVKYTQKEYKGDLIFGMDKNNITRIIYSDGNELILKNPMFDAAQYEKQHKNALKVGFLSPLFGATSFTYEKSLKPGKSIEATLGIIGLGTDIGGNNASGMYLKFGYKFIKTPDYHNRGTRFDHVLKGGYIRPEISFSNYSVNSDQSLTYSGGPKVTNSMFAFMLNFGKQLVFDDRFLVDWFAGLGYGFGQPHENMAFHYAFIGGVPDFPLAVTTGLRIGVLF